MYLGFKECVPDTDLCESQGCNLHVERVYRVQSYHFLASVSVMKTLALDCCECSWGRSPAAENKSRCSFLSVCLCVCFLFLSVVGPGLTPKFQKYPFP